MCVCVCVCVCVCGCVLCWYVCVAWKPKNAIATMLLNYVTKETKFLGYRILILLVRIHSTHGISKNFDTYPSVAHSLILQNHFPCKSNCSSLQDVMNAR